MKEPLISVIVVTYNSSATVLETLESIFAQQYENLELIVSDDCSKDDTVAKVKKWLEKHKSRFAATEIIEVNKNTGVAPNFNRGVKKSKGGWIKIIAGDDIILPECISEMENFVKDQPQISFCFAKTQSFKVEDGKRVIFPVDIYFGDLSKMFFGCNSQRQYQKLLRANYCSAPTAFMRRETLIELGYFDESFPMVEDYPLWLKATKAGYKLYFLDKVVVLYRMANSVTKAEDKIYNVNFLARVQLLKNKYTNPYIPKYDLLYYAAEARDRLCEVIIIKLFNNRRNRLTVAIWFLFFCLSFKHWRYSIIPGIIQSVKSKKIQVKEMSV